MEADSRYIKVSVGSSDRDIMLLNNLKRIAFENEWSLLAWDDSVYFYLLHESERCFPCADYGIILFRSMHLDIRRLMQFVRDGSLTTILDSYEMPRAFFQMLRCFSPAYFFIPDSNSKKKHAQRRERKYLSREKEAAVRQIGCSLAWIILVFLIDFLLSVFCPWWNI